MALVEQMAAVLVILGIAAVVRVAATSVEFVSYHVLLVVAGILVGAVGAEPSFALSSEFILSVLLPTILFEGAEATKTEAFRESFAVAVVLAVVGLPVSVVVSSVVGRAVLDLPLIVLLVFAAIIYPIDPVSVLAVFGDADAPDRLAVIAENESHLGDGFSIVIYGAFLRLLQRQAETGEPLAGLVGPGELVGLVVEVAWFSVGGLAVGGALGAGAFGVLRSIDERMTELLVLVVLPYASFYVAEHALHVSGVLATVAAGLVVGIYAKASAIHPDNVAFVERTWATAAFLVNTLLFVLVGFEAPVRRILGNAGLVAAATGLVLVSRAVAVYGLLGLINRVLTGSVVPFRGQHVLAWGGMHTVVPIALLFTLPAVPYSREIGTMVLGVAVVSIVVQGFVLPAVLRVTGFAE